MSYDSLSISQEHETLQTYLEMIYRHVGDALEKDPVMVVPVCPPAGLDVYGALHQVYHELKPEDDEVLLYRSPVGMSPAYIAVYRLEGVNPAPPKEFLQFIDPATCKSGYLCYGVPASDYMSERKKKATANTYQYMKYTDYHTDFKD